MRAFVTAVVILLSILVSVVHAADRYVAQNGQTPASPYADWTGAASNIQDAVDASTHGDTVWVGPGRYTAGTNSVLSGWATNVVYIHGKAITLRSSSGDPADTVIDGEGLYRCVWVGSTNRDNSPYIIDGFTITNGFAAGVNTHAAGIRIYNDNGLMREAVVRNCVLTDNHVSDGGGRGSAGALYAGWAQTIPVGDGMFVIVSNCVIRNSSTNGICLNSYATNVNDASMVVDCVVEDNWGSGIVLIGNSYVETFVRDCVIQRNVTPNYGGGLNLSGRRTDIGNTLIARNAANWGWTDPAPTTNYTGGGAIYSSVCTNLVRNCTIVSNYTGSRGTAVYKHWNTQGAMFFWNTIIYGNRNTVGISDYSMDAGYGYFTNCLSPALPVGGGNVKTPPPAFMDFEGGDYRLKAWSSGVDAGITQEWMTAATDLAGQPRVSANGLVDMGAYETTLGDHPGYHVAQNGQTPQPPFTNVLMAASNIQDAVDAVETNYPAVVWIHPGRYTVPPAPTNYIGTNIVFINRPMTLTGVSGNPDDTIIDGEGLYRGIAVSYPQNETRRFVFENLTITNGYAITIGGGMLLDCPINSGNAWTGVVNNCRFMNNLVVYGPGTTNPPIPPPTGYIAEGAWGGGLGSHNRDAFFGLIISNCVFKANMATNAVTEPGLAGGIDASASGGGIYCQSKGQVVIVGSSIQNNRGYKGGNVFRQGGTLTVMDTEISGGWAGLTGNQGISGGIFHNGTTRLWNSLLYGNRTGSGARGAAINNELQSSNGLVEVFNCTIVSNYGAGIYIRPWAKAQDFFPSLHLVNSIVYSNTTDLSLGAGGDGPPDNYSTYASNSCIGSTNSGVMYGPTNLLYFLGLSANNFTNNPRFAGFAVQNFRLQHTSPCINAGLNEAWMEGALDLDGNPRISPKYSGTVDVGAYEFPIQAGSIFSVR